MLHLAFTQQKYFNFCRAVKGAQSSPSALLKREETCYRNEPQLTNLFPTELGLRSCKAPTNLSEASRPSTTTVFSLADETKRLCNRSALAFPETSKPTPKWLLPQTFPRVSREPTSQQSFLQRASAVTCSRSSRSSHVARSSILHSLVSSIFPSILDLTRSAGARTCY